MIGFNKLFLLGCAALTGNAQDLIGTNPAGFWTWDHNYKTNLYTITRVTPATLRPGNNDYYVGMWGRDGFSNWTKRVGLAWYFDRICPCNFGCDGRFCTWCANDNRLPEWYSRSLSDTEAVEPLNMGPIYDCNDNLDTGVVIKMEPAEIDYKNYEFHLTLDYLADELWGNAYIRFNWSSEVGTTLARGPAFRWSRVELLIREISTVATDITGNGFADGVVIMPEGIKYTYIWWAWTINQPTAWGGYQRMFFYVNAPEQRLPFKTDALGVYSLYRQGISGSVILDIMTMAADGNPFLTWEMRIPRANYFVYIRSDDNDGWNYYYPKVNEILCGPASNPPTCRTHDQQYGRLVNRVSGTFSGWVAPFINKTVYSWDRERTDYENRHLEDIWSIDRLEFDGKNIGFDYDWSMADNVESRISTEDGYVRDLENPQFSYKLI